MGKILVPLFFCGCLMLGSWISLDSWDGAVFVYLGEQRSPAAVRSLVDYSALDRRALFSSLHKQMLESARLSKDEAYVNLTLGHPLVRAAGGQNEFACPVQGRAGLFDRVELTFVGAGISSSGLQPRMIIETDCRPGQTLGELSTIRIPMQDIVTATARDQEMQVYGDQPVIVRLEQIPGEWPLTWVLWNVRLFRDANPEDSLVIDSSRIREVKTKLMSFDWK